MKNIKLKKKKLVNCQNHKNNKNKCIYNSNMKNQQ